MSRRRRKSVCCCNPGPPPVCGNCDRCSYNCCTSQMGFSNVYNPYTESVVAEEQMFNMMYCQARTVAPLANRTRASSVGLEYFAVLTQPPDGVGGFVPWCDNPPYANYSTPTPGSNYGAATGSCLTPYAGLPDPDFVPFNAQAPITYDPGLITIYSFAGYRCCSGSACDPDDNFPTVCVLDECWCDPDSFWEDICDPPFVNSGVYAAVEKVLELPANGAAIRGGVTSRLNDPPGKCHPYIDAIVRWDYAMPWGSRFTYNFHLEAYGEWCPYQPPDCSSFPPCTGKCPKSAIWYGGIAKESQYGVLTEGICGPCNEQSYDVVCYCDRSANIETPTSQDDGCLDVRLAACADSNPYGVYNCNACGDRIGGGDFTGMMGL